MHEEEQGAWNAEGTFANQLSKHSSTGSGGKGVSLHQGKRLSSLGPGASKMMVSGATDSAMIEQERKALEKIKLKQV